MITPSLPASIGHPECGVVFSGFTEMRSIFLIRALQSVPFLTPLKSKGFVDCPNKNNSHSLFLTLLLVVRLFQAAQQNSIKQQDAYQQELGNGVGWDHGGRPSR
jgi:hypothetical protein